MCLTESVSFRFNRIMASGSIWSVSCIVFWSPDLANYLSGVISEGTQLYVNLSTDNLTLLEFLILAYFKGLVSEFKLKAISAIKLLPTFFISSFVLPSPVEILNSFYFFNHLLRNLVKGLNLFFFLNLTFLKSSLLEKRHFCRVRWPCDIDVYIQASIIISLLGLIDSCLKTKVSQVVERCCYCKV